jgi:hypothetical protein
MEIAVYPKVLNRGQAGFVYQATLPNLDVKRWTFPRKAAVVIAVADGVLTRAQACRWYKLTEDELLSWEEAFEAHGLPGLRATRLQQLVSSRRRTTLKARARLPRLIYSAIDHADFLLMLARLRLDDWRCRPHGNADRSGHPTGGRALAPRSFSQVISTLRRRSDPPAVRSTSPASIAYSRSSQYRPAGCGSASAPAAFASRGRSFRHRSARPSRPVGLDLMPAIETPADQQHARRCGVAERHRRAAAQRRRLPRPCALTHTSPHLAARASGGELGAALLVGFRVPPREPVFGGRASSCRCVPALVSSVDRHGEAG